MTTRCEDCWKGRGPMPFHYSDQSTTEVTGIKMDICPVCAGKLCQALIGYFKERTRLGLRGGRRYKNTKRPIRFMGAWRCARCEVQLKDWKMGDPPTCEECR